MNDPTPHRISPQARAAAEDLLAFLDASPCSFHAATEIAFRFAAGGFTLLDERGRFAIEPGGRYLVTRNDSAVVAFVAGSAPPSDAGFRLVAAHTDSPGLRLKPNPELTASGLVYLGVEIYGGPILATWSDRDFGICGRAMLLGPDGSPEARLFRTERPVVSIPNLAIHLNRSVNDNGLKTNAQTQLTPVLGTAVPGVSEKGAVKRMVADLLDVSEESVLDLDAILFDTQPAAFGGLEDEFLRSGRLDDLEMCHAASTALLATADRSTAETRVAIFYDNEETGSQTTQGARSNLVPAVLERIALGLGDDREGYLSALAGSRLISADNSHAIHPGHPEKHEPNHAPRLNEGPVIKLHASRAYATDAAAASFFELCCRKAGVPCQRFVNRSDSRSGSTIGSMVAAQLGVLTVDVGNAQYAMHSVREMAGTADVRFMIQALEAFFG